MRSKLHKILAEDNVELGLHEWTPVDVRYRFPILFIHGFAQNHFSWDGKNGGLAPELTKKGIHTFAIDLRGSGYSRLKKLFYNYTFEDFVSKDVQASVNFIRKLGYDRLIIGGHSLGGIVSYAWAVQNPDTIAGIITFGSPIIFGKGVPIMRFFGRVTVAIGKFPASKLIYLVWPREVAMKILGILGVVGAPFMRYKSIVKIAPLYPSYTRNFESIYDFYEKLVRGFDFSSPRLFTQILRWAGEGKITSFDGRIDFTKEFEKIKSPLLVFAGTLDKLAPPESVKPILKIAQSKIKIYKEYEVGHLDIIEGKFAKTQISQDIEDFVKLVEEETQI